jgi:hypothetical protein
MINKDLQSLQKDNYLGTQPASIPLHEKKDLECSKQKTTFLLSTCLYNPVKNMTDRSRPSLMQILLTDYLSLTLMIFIGTLVGFMAYAGVRYGKILTELNQPLGAIVLLSAGLLVWKVNRIYSVCNAGQETTATITNIIRFFRGRRQIFFTHNFADGKYSCRLTVMRNGRTKKCAIGDQVIVWVDVKNPKKAYIKEFYTTHKV